MTNAELLDAFEVACDQQAHMPTRMTADKLARLREEILRRMEVGKG